MKRFLHWALRPLAGYPLVPGWDWDAWELEHVEHFLSLYEETT